MTLGEGQRYKKFCFMFSGKCDSVTRPVGSALCGMSVPEKNSDCVQVSCFQGMKADNDTIPGTVGGEFYSPDRNKMKTNCCLAA